MLQGLVLVGMEVGEIMYVFHFQRSMKAVQSNVTFCGLEATTKITSNDPILIQLRPVLLLPKNIRHVRIFFAQTNLTASNINVR